MAAHVLLIHGSAADRSTWSIQCASSLARRYALDAYDRPMHPTVEDHAHEAAARIADRAVVVGSSFGAVIALELARTYPDKCLGMVLIEPPMAATDAAPAAREFLVDYDRRVAEQGGPAAAEHFLRTVLGDAAFERMPRAFAERAKSKWAEIRADSEALIAYRPRYPELAAVRVPALLVGGERSAPYFRATLDALAGALPDARLEIVAGAGHMLHAEAPRRFAELLTGFHP